jgi:hypothetical protein
VKSGRLGSFTPAPGAVPQPAQAPPSAATAPAQQSVAAPAAPATSAQAAPAAQAIVTPAAPASCEKGLLWPFVRSAGDCPTAAELKAQGVRVQAKPASEQGNLAKAILGSGDAARPAPQVAAQPVAAQPVAQPAAAPQAAQPAAAASCSKGLLWPFVREQGDCPTSAEVKSGAARPTPAAVKAPETTAAAAAAPPAPRLAAPVVAAPAVVPAAANTTAPGAESCHRGVLWPFVKEEGDCLTEAEKKSGSTRPVAPVKPTEPAAASVTAIPAVSAATPPAATPAASTDAPAANPETCHKGVLWPFVRAAGDCPTDAERGTRRPGRNQS